MSAGAAVGAAARRAERRLVEHFRSAGAVGPSSAGSIPDQRWMGKRVLSRLIRVGAVGRVEGKYYLDEEAYSTYRARRKRMTMAVLASLAVVAGLIIWWASTM